MMTGKEKLEPPARNAASKFSADILARVPKSVLTMLEGMPADQPYSSENVWRYTIPAILRGAAENERAAAILHDYDGCEVYDAMMRELPTGKHELTILLWATPSDFAKFIGTDPPEGIYQGFARMLIARSSVAEEPDSRSHYWVPTSNKNEEIEENNIVCPYLKGPREQPPSDVPDVSSGSQDPAPMDVANGLCGDSGLCGDFRILGTLGIEQGLPRDPRIIWLKAMHGEDEPPTYICSFYLPPAGGASAVEDRRRLLIDRIAAGSRALAGRTWASRSGQEVWAETVWTGDGNTRLSELSRSHDRVRDPEAPL